MITPRLQAIMNLVETKTIADIGTDHAYIPIKLAQQEKIIKAVACDKNSGPIEIARQNVLKYNLNDIIELRQGDGLEPIEEGETETVIIAGMGGNLIADIIKDNIEKAKASVLILQPMNAQYELRKFLINNGFKIEKEELAKEGFKVYNIMIVKPGKDNKERKEIDFHIPGEILGHELCNMLIAKKKREFTKIINGRKKSGEDNSELVEYYDNLLKETERIEKCY